MHRVLTPNGKAIITTPFMWEEHEMPYDFARYTTPALEFLYKKHGFNVIQKEKAGNTILVLSQFIINYFKNIFPTNKIIRQLLLLPIVFICNCFGNLFSALLPKDQSTYFNNVFLIEKAE